MVTAVVAAVLMTAPVVAGAATWEIDPAHSSIQFKVRHLMVSWVKGTFGSFKGHATSPTDDPTKATVEAEIDVASVDTGVEKRDQHLKTADFFDVAKYPTMTFKSKRVEAAGKGYKVVGDLTLHGVTREVTLDVEGEGKIITNPMDGTKRAGASANTTINRKDFGLTWNKALETGGVVVGDEVYVTIEVELVRKE
jgi:polyisoprenoid-binding protein YceI